ncbi:hypothetical protein AB0L74_19205 [Streptomyces sp. NPDC052020]
MDFRSPPPLVREQVPVHLIIDRHSAPRSKAKARRFPLAALAKRAALA